MWTLVSMGILGPVTVGWAQGERSHVTLTEIWMSGEDLAVTMRIPQDRRSAQHSYDEVARSMVQIAELRYQDRDEETAEWLHRWARELTDGRIGNKPRAAGRQQQSLVADMTAVAHPDSLANEWVAPSIPDFDPAGLAIEFPISAFTDNLPPDETQPLRRDDQLELASQQQTSGEARRSETRSERATELPNAPAQRSRLSELVVNPRKNPLDAAGRQVALVPASVQQDLANHLHDVAPAAPTDRPIMLALSCFAAGVGCCFVLHTLLLLTPVRLTVRRSNRSPSRSSDNASAHLIPTGEKLAAARGASFSTPPHAPNRDPSQPRDSASSMVEEFYNVNIALFERFAQSGD